MDGQENSLGDVEVPAAAGIVEYPTREDQSLKCDAVTLHARWVQWAGRSTDAVGAMSYAIVEWLLISDEVLSYDLSLCKVRMAQIETGVEDGHLDVGSR